MVVLNDLMTQIHPTVKPLYVLNIQLATRSPVIITSCMFEKMLLIIIDNCPVWC